MPEMTDGMPTDKRVLRLYLCRSDESGAAFVKFSIRFSALLLVDVVDDEKRGDIFDL